MSWVRIDDNLTFHAKVVQAGNEAIGVWIRLLAWSSNHLTDGVVPARIAKLVAEHDEPLSKLVEARLLDEHKDGYVIHDYHEHNRPAAEVKAQRKADAARKANGRLKQGRDSNGRIAGVQSLSGRNPAGIQPDSARNPNGVPNESASGVRLLPQDGDSDDVEWSDQLSVDQLTHRDMASQVAESSFVQPESERNPAGLRADSMRPSAGPDPTRPDLLVKIPPTPQKPKPGSIAELAEAWSAAGLQGLPGASELAALCDALTQLKIEPRRACVAFGELLAEWRAKKVRAAPTPRLMLKHIAAVQLIVEGKWAGSVQPESERTPAGIQPDAREPNAGLKRLRREEAERERIAWEQDRLREGNS